MNRIIIFICFLIGCNKISNKDYILEKFNDNDYNYIGQNNKYTFSIDSETVIDKIYSDSNSTFFLLYSLDKYEYLLYIKSILPKNKALNRSFYINKFLKLDEYNDQRKFNLNLINKYYNDLNKFTIDQRKQIINRTILLVLLELPRALFISKNGFNNLDILYTMKNINQIKSEEDLSLYYNNLNELKILYLDTNSYKKSINSDYSFMLPSLKKIRNINTKYYEEIKMTLKSKDTFYFYSIPDYYLYRIYYIKNEVYFNELTSDSIWREFYLPNDIRYLNF